MRITWTWAVYRQPPALLLLPCTGTMPNTDTPLAPGSWARSWVPAAGLWPVPWVVESLVGVMVGVAKIAIALIEALAVRNTSGIQIMSIINGVAEH